MNAEDRRGIDVLRGAVETVATDLERRARPRARPVAPRRVLVGALALAGAAAVVFGVVRLASPPPVRGVEILELKIQGRTVRGIVVDDTASGSIVVMPQVPGPPRAAAFRAGERP